ncbi:MAG TPA: cupin domain-containing protein [Aggregatilinea sp.]|jgi:quercetin dioxygenase-like cupin family protein|uniref:cupin domain-containing protein n=1 Tax=Aggregatilinea sp. TaxID=2806333 RepID=UPI002C1D872C|nr:cupin domain-containing protein [Aggregatilinea sp.]HML24112.1 cupin domain-containing protein [Aggregatilinea sp.]
MLTINLNDLQLRSLYAENTPDMRCRATFPFFGALGTEDSAAVYFELDPGHQLGTHTDSAEETWLILQGTVEAVVGDEQIRLAQGEMAIVPRMISHNVRNAGNEVVKVLGFFSDPNNVATFEDRWMPDGTNVVDTAMIPVPTAEA